ncbi:4Fe-4S dicluster domain-containing protein, partial [Verrucomicrobiota bacterium]
ARVKQWDSCLYKNFARVAGGGNPRKHRGERLYNRFDKKFNFFPEILGIYACDGCGRCAEACTGKIDIREVLKRMVDEQL